MKSRRGDADNRERTPVQPHDPSHDRRVAGETPPPEVVGQHEDRSITLRAALGRSDDSADRRRHAENRKVVAGHSLDGDRLGAAAGVERRAQRHAADEIGERGVVRTVVLEIAERETVRQLDVAIERRHRHELAGTLDRERPEEERVQDREERRRRADADREREDGRERKGRRAPQGANRVGRVLLQNREVLGRRRAEDVLRRVEPEARDRQRRAVARVAALRAEDLLHLAAVLVPEIERQQPQQRAEDALGAGARGAARRHAVLGRSSFFSSARSTSDSSRSMSATASRRPRVVRR